MGSICFKDGNANLQLPKAVTGKSDEEKKFDALVKAIERPESAKR